MTNSKKGKLGEKYVKEYLVNQGYVISKNRENGCDLIAIKNKKKIKIEVKTTSNFAGGIPDMHSSEFILIDDKYFFVADYLYVLRIDKKNNPIQLDIISKKEIDSFSDSHKLVERIRTTKLDRVLNKREIGATIMLPSKNNKK